MVSQEPLTGQGSIANKNVGNGKTITLNILLTLNNGANPTHLASNYTFTGGTHTFDVTKRTWTFSGTKVYDGNANSQAHLNLQQLLIWAEEKH